MNKEEFFKIIKNNLYDENQRISIMMDILNKNSDKHFIKDNLTYLNQIFELRNNILSNFKSIKMNLVDKVEEKR